MNKKDFCLFLLMLCNVFSLEASLSFDTLIKNKIIVAAFILLPIEIYLFKNTPDYNKMITTRFDEAFTEAYVYLAKPIQQDISAEAESEERQNRVNAFINVFYTKCGIMPESIIPSSYLSSKEMWELNPPQYLKNTLDISKKREVYGYCVSRDVKQLFDQPTYGKAIFLCAVQIFLTVVGLSERWKSNQ